MNQTSSFLVRGQRLPWTGARLRIAAALVAGLAASRATTAPCGSGPQVLALDHVVVVVQDLDSAEALLRAAGFQVKVGRLHADNLLNRHVKFRDGTEIELMTLTGPAKSTTACEYERLLAGGDQGVYAALWTTDPDRIGRIAEKIGAVPRQTRSGPWHFVTFPGLADTAAVFFGWGAASANDPESVLAHENGAVALAAAWVEAGPALDRVLSRLGGTPCETVTLPDGRTGARWPLRSGSIVVVRPQRPAEPRVLGVELRRKEGPAAEPRLIQLLDRFWISIR